MKISVAFFGITRSLSYTIESIRDNVLRPAHESGDVSVACHFFRQTAIDNLRTGERGRLDPNEFKLLNSDHAEFSEQMTILNDVGFDEIKTYGDHWDDGFKTVSNLLHQLFSLKAVTRIALESDPDVVIFCRPDLEYHDSLLTSLQRANAIQNTTVILPRWQRHKGGANDRFAICVGVPAIKAYGNRLDYALPFCRDLKLELHSERLVRYALAQSGVRTENLNARASRVRADGKQVDEDFSEQSWKQFRNSMRFRRKMLR